MTKAEMRCMEDKIDELRKTIEDRDAYIEELKNENAGLKYQLDMKRTEISELQDAVREKVRGVELATDRYVQVSCANTRLVEENVALKKEKDKMSGCIVDLQINLMKAEDENVVLKKLRGQNESFKKQVDDITIARDTALNDDVVIMDQLKKKNATLQYKIDALEGDIVDLTNSYKKELEKKEKENLDLDNNVKDMFATVRSLKKDKANLKDNLGFLSVKLQKSDEIIHDLKDDNEELKAEIEVLLEKNYDLDNHVKNLVAQDEISKREIGTLKYQLDIAKERADAISLNKELLKKDNEIRSLKQNIVDLNDKKNNLIDKLNDETRRLYLERKKSSAFEQEIDRLLGLCKDKVDVKSSDESSEEKILYPIDFIRTVNQDLLDIDKRFKKLEDGTLFTNDMITGACARLDKIEKTIGIDLNLSEVKKDIEKLGDDVATINRCLMDDLSRLNKLDDSIKGIENWGKDITNMMTNAFNRICKLEEAQPKKSSKKTSKKAQFSTVS